MFEVTLWPIFAAGVFNIILGMVWYNPKVFGATWMRGAGLAADMMERGRKRMPLMAFVAFLGAMLIAYVMNHFGIAWGVFDWIGAIELGIWTWLGFAVVPLLSSFLWESRPFSYFAVNAGFWLLSFIGIAVILVILA